MAVTIEALFRNPNLHNKRRFLGEYQFSIGDLGTRITFRLYERLDSIMSGDGEPKARKGEVEFVQSHFIKTPLTPGPYIEDAEGLYILDRTEEARQWDLWAIRTLRQAISRLIQDYENAVTAGHTPDENWLAPNPDF